VIAREEDAERQEVEASHLEHWRELYDATYAAKRPDAADFDLVGWNDSYGGGAIPAHEMRLWLDERLRQLRALAPRDVLEIGCGTGLVLTRLAPHCESYVGLDFSRPALDR